MKQALFFVTGSLTATGSIYTFIEKTTPIIAFMGLVFGTVLSFTMCVHWIRKEWGKKNK